MSWKGSMTDRKFVLSIFPNAIYDTLYDYTGERAHYIYESIGSFTILGKSYESRSGAWTMAKEKALEKLVEVFET